MIDDSLYVRQAILGRLRQAGYAHAPDVMGALGFDGPVTAAGPSESPALGYAPGPGFPVKALPAAAPAFASDVTFWSQGVGAWGHIEGDGNAAEVHRNLAGFFSGVDARFGELARIGLVGGYTNSSVSVDARSSSAGIDTAHLGAYAGASFGAFNLRGGAAYGFHSIDTSRTIIFPGFLDGATTASRWAGSPPSRSRGWPGCMCKPAALPRSVAPRRSTARATPTMSAIRRSVAGWRRPTFCPTAWR
jgi:uncharacterized protein with beta-barrel porin domain